MRSVGSHSTSGREKEGIKGRTGNLFFYPFSLLSVNGKNAFASCEFCISSFFMYNFW